MRLGFPAPAVLAPAPGLLLGKSYKTRCSPALGGLPRQVVRRFGFLDDHELVPDPTSLQTAA